MEPKERQSRTDPKPTALEETLHRYQVGIEDLQMRVQHARPEARMRHAEMIDAFQARLRGLSQAARDAGEQGEKELRALELELQAAWDKLQAAFEDLFLEPNA